MTRRRGPAEVTVKPRRATPLKYKLNTQAWTVLKAKHKAYSKSRHLPCWLARYGMCLLDGVPIDYVHPDTDASYETDHKVPRSVDMQKMYVWSNLEASHRRCNRSRQDKAVEVEHIWVRPRF